MAIPVVEFHIREYKNRLLNKSGVFQRILCYILKLNDGEPTRFRPIFTKWTFNYLVKIVL